jgi:hypothetical protein
LTDDTFEDGLALFFYPFGKDPVCLADSVSLSATNDCSAGHARHLLLLRQRIAVVDAIQRELTPLRQHMSEQTALRFYSSSLLFVYEGKLSSDASSTDVDKDEPVVVKLKMIDMAHVFPLRRDDEIGDNGYSQALERLSQFLDKIVTRLRSIERTIAK